MVGSPDAFSRRDEQKTARGMTWRPADSATAAARFEVALFMETRDLETRDLEARVLEARVLEARVLEAKCDRPPEKCEFKARPFSHRGVIPSKN